MQAKNLKFKIKHLKKEGGQVVIILLLIMLVGLVLAISVTQKSVNDLAVSTQTEQATRAFSAAEAGVERALSDVLPAPTYTLSSTDTGNDSQATVRVLTDLPRPEQADEEPLGASRDTISQFWLADERNGLTEYYPRDQKIDILYGDPTIQSYNTDTRMPAIEIYVIGRNAGDYIRSTPYLFDTVVSRATGANGNNFQTSPINCNDDGTLTNSPPNYGHQINTDNSPNATVTDRHFRCSIRLDFSQAHTASPLFNGIQGMVPIMLRIRILYADNQPLAVKPVPCPAVPSTVPGPPAGFACSLPHQKSIYTSTGRSGQSIKSVQVSRRDSYFLPFFDFAIFSTSDISK